MRTLGVQVADVFDASTAQFVFAGSERRRPNAWRSTGVALSIPYSLFIADLTPRGRKMRVSKNTFDPQLAAPHPHSPTAPKTLRRRVEPTNSQQQVVAAVPIP